MSFSNLTFAKKDIPTFFIAKEVNWSGKTAGKVENNILKTIQERIESIFFNLTLIKESNNKESKFKMTDIKLSPDEYGMRLSCKWNNEETRTSAYVEPFEFINTLTFLGNDEALCETAGNVLFNKILFKTLFDVNKGPYKSIKIVNSTDIVHKKQFEKGDIIYLELDLNLAPGIETSVNYELCTMDHDLLHGQGIYFSYIQGKDYIQEAVDREGKKVTLFEIIHTSVKKTHYTMKDHFVLRVRYKPFPEIDL